ncbi:hypothetical protein V6259_18020 [Marinomonas sp. TI.3.20]|uniref:hypothetical protein n=1 Tax=Marinomonas sp. TI.3.20 TaxID=3121296 RepID=UPI00311D6DAF
MKKSKKQRNQKKASIFGTIKAGILDGIKDLAKDATKQVGIVAITLITATSLNVSNALGDNSSHKEDMKSAVFVGEAQCEGLSFPIEVKPSQSVSSLQALQALVKNSKASGCKILIKEVK